MNLRRALIVGAVILLTASSVFAGGGQEAATAGEKVEITFMHIWNRNVGGDPGVFAMIDKFYAENPNIKVNEDAVAHDQYHGQKFKTLAAANELPELFIVNTMELKPIQRKDMVLDWTEIVKADSSWRDSFNTGAWTEVTIDGRIWAVPNQLIANNAIYYNEDILQNAGYTQFPGTWAEFMMMSGKLKSMSVVPMAVGNKAGWPAVSCFLEILINRMVGTEWFTDIMQGGGQRQYADPGLVEALKLFKKYYDSGYFNEDINSITNAEARTYFFTEQSAMFSEGSWAVGSVVNDAPEEVEAKTHVTTMPFVTGGKGKKGVLTGGSGWNWAASPWIEGATQDAVIKFAKTLTSLDRAKISLENNFMPPIKASLVTYDTSKVSPLQVELNKLMAAAPSIDTMYAVQCTPAVAEVLYRKMQELMVGTATAEEVAKEAQKAYEMSMLAQ